MSFKNFLNIFYINFDKIKNVCIYIIYTKIFTELEYLNVFFFELKSFKTNIKYTFIHE